MSEETKQEPTLDIRDIEGAAHALKVANKRGAFELDESGQIAPMVERLIAWTTAYRESQAAATEAGTEQEEATSEG